MIDIADMGVLGRDKSLVEKLFIENVEKLEKKCNFEREFSI